MLGFISIKCSELCFWVWHRESKENYIKMTKRFGWSKNVLINNIENKAYEKYLLNHTNFDDAVPESYRLQAKLAVKDEYTFDFLEMGLEHSEHELELGLINNVRSFLIEMGGISHLLEINTILISMVKFFLLTFYYSIGSLNV